MTATQSTTYNEDSTKYVTPAQLRVLQACEAMLQSRGYVSYPDVARNLGVTKQYCGKVLRTLYERGVITETQYNRLRSKVRRAVETGKGVSREFRIEKELDEFVQAQAELCHCFPAVVVNNALRTYMSLLRQASATPQAAPSTQN